MKANVLFVSAILLTCASSLYSQTNDRIKRESDRNREERSQSGSGDYSGGDSDFSSDAAAGCIDGCSSGCADGGCMIFMDLVGSVFDGLSNANANIIAREADIPRIHSLELGCNLGYINPNSTLLMPSFKYRGGLLSTSMRIFSNTEKHLSGKNNYSTFNWQILQFNLAVEKSFNMNIGTGILYEFYSKEIFNEFGLGFEFFPARFYIPLELRFTPDYVTGTTVLFEAHTGVGYTVKKWGKTSLRLQLNYTYANYYEAVDVHGLSAGFTVLFD
ncbi:MAG TPA: hypothetical protein VHO90_02990 [Bacteroidales bacterium]|nr:hypothetical protein [Bacteroidales bacterium]